MGRLMVERDEHHEREIWQLAHVIISGVHEAMIATSELPPDPDDLNKDGGPKNKAKAKRETKRYIAFIKNTRERLAEALKTTGAFAHAYGRGALFGYTPPKKEADLTPEEKEARQAERLAKEREMAAEAEAAVQRVLAMGKGARFESGRKMRPQSQSPLASRRRQRQPGHVSSLTEGVLKGQDIE